MSLKIYLAPMGFLKTVGNTSDSKTYRYYG